MEARRLSAGRPRDEAAGLRSRHPAPKKSGSLRESIPLAPVALPKTTLLVCTAAPLPPRRARTSDRSNPTQQILTPGVASRAPHAYRKSPR